MLSANDPLEKEVEERLSIETPVKLKVARHRQGVPLDESTCLGHFDGRAQAV
jgi:hypothetical protein